MNSIESPSITRKNGGSKSASRSSKGNKLKRKGDPESFAAEAEAPTAATSVIATTMISNSTSATFTSAGSDEDEYASTTNMSGFDVSVDPDPDSDPDKVPDGGTAGNSFHDDPGSGNPNKRPRTQEEKKLDRILANRRSARKSRERRKQLQENLEKSVLLLTRQNEDLTRENETLKQELRVLINVFQEKQRTHTIPTVPSAGLGGVGVGVNGGLATYPGTSATAADLRHHQLQQQLAAATGNGLGGGGSMFQNTRNHPNAASPAFNPAVLAAAMQQQQQHAQVAQQQQQNQSQKGQVGQPQNRPGNVQDFLLNAQAAAAAGLYGQHQNSVANRLNMQSHAASSLFSAAAGQPPQPNQGGGNNGTAL